MVDRAKEPWTLLLQVLPSKERLGWTHWVIVETNSTLGETFSGMWFRLRGNKTFMSQSIGTIIRHGIIAIVQGIRILHWCNGRRPPKIHHVLVIVEETFNNIEPHKDIEGGCIIVTTITTTSWPVLSDPKRGHFVIVFILIGGNHVSWIVRSPFHVRASSQDN